MEKYCQRCRKNIYNPGTREMTKYAKFWRDNRCYYCNTLLQIKKEDKVEEAPAVKEKPPESDNKTARATIKLNFISLLRRFFRGRNQPSSRNNTDNFTRYCYAFSKNVSIIKSQGELPMCEETCTKNGVCDNRPCSWSFGNAIAAKARAELDKGKTSQEEWIDNSLRVDFPFMVDYTETAWDPCSVPMATPKGGDCLSFMSDKENVGKLDSTISRSLRDNCLKRTINSGELFFANLGIQGYDDDPRGLFQIPEVMAWVRACEDRIPDLGAWLSPFSITWFAMAVFSASQKHPNNLDKPSFSIEFYKDWVKAHIIAASRVLKEHGANGELIQRVTDSMWHKSGWALHQGWGAWFRGVPYDMSLAKELWLEHRPLTTLGAIGYNDGLLARIRAQALSKKS